MSRAEHKLLFKAALRAPLDIEACYTSSDDTTSDGLPAPVVRRLTCATISGLKQVEGGACLSRPDRIGKGEIAEQRIARDRNFDFAEFSSLGCDAIHRDPRYRPFVRRLEPETATVAREFVFHLEREVIGPLDRSRIVRCKNGLVSTSGSGQSQVLARTRRRR